MTVMIDCFFGLPQTFVRGLKIKSLSLIAVKLYIALWYESERYRSRELIRTTRALIDLVGGSRNSHAKARRELVSAGLVEIEPYGPDGFIFHLCNPETGKPWSMPPTERVIYQRRGAPPALIAPNSPHTAKPPKSPIAGTNFPYGSNIAKNGSDIQPLAETLASLKFEEFGEQQRPPILKK